MISRTIQALTSIGLTEATVGSRSADDAAFSAAQHARSLRGDSSLYYSPKDRKWAYGIKSKSTGGADIKNFKGGDKGYERVAQIRQGGSIRTFANKGRMTKQLDRIAKSSQLSRSEKEAYIKAALEKKGRAALPGSVHKAVSQTTRPDARLSKPRNVTKPGERTRGALAKLGGLLGKLKSRLTS